MIKIAINGFGRIGRPCLRRILEEHPDLEIVAINDLTDVKTLAHLLKFDSLYGIYNKSVEAKENSLIIDNKEIKIFSEKDPSKLPWKDLGIDVVLECTGIFRDYDGAKQHIAAGAKKVIISAPSKTPEKINSYILGINAQDFDAEKDEIIDMGSCTTNCLAPVVKVLNDNLKIQKGFMTTIHSYTSDQRILDLPHKDLRRARGAAQNIIPTTTGATKAIGRVIPEMDGKLDGIAIRVPTPVVSVVDLICQTEKSASAEEVNNLFKKAEKQENFQGILATEDAPLVSTDYIGNSFSSIVDTQMTMAKDNLVKIISWYDNECGYSSRMVEFAEFIGKKL
jgi:glyceraldehyde 3-phosphate dehydrogenase